MSQSKTKLSSDSKAKYEECHRVAEKILLTKIDKLITSEVTPAEIVDSILELFIKEKFLKVLF